MRTATLEATRETTMILFTFKAPTLFQPDAYPSDDEFIHDEPDETAERLVKIKKLVVWLKTEMEKHGIVTKGLGLDPSGWVFEVPSDHGFVMCFVSNLDDGDETLIRLLVTEMGGAPEGVDSAVEALLNKSSEIIELHAARLFHAGAVRRADNDEDGNRC